MTPAQRTLLLEKTNYAARWGLVSAWNLQDLTDAYGGHVLTNNNGVTFTAGKLGNAGTFASASSRSLTVASDASLQAGNVDWWLGFWLKLSAKTTDYAGLICKGNVATGTVAREYEIAYDRDLDHLYAVVCNGTTGTTAVNSTFGAFTLGTWYFVLTWLGAAAAKIYLSVNQQATPDSAALSITPGVTTRPVCFGGFEANNTPSHFADCQIGPAFFGKNPPLGIAALATEIRDRLYNGGAGRLWPF